MAKKGLRSWVQENWVDIANKKPDGSYPKCGRSGGEKRKTEILRSILLDAKFILLDEPFAGVDPISVEEIIKMLKAFKENIGIFISDHNFRDVINVCDEIILLNQGEVLLKGTPNQVKNDPVAKKLYFGELN